MHSSMHFQIQLKNFMSSSIKKNKFHAFLYVFFKKKKIKISYSNKFHAFLKQKQNQISCIYKRILQKKNKKRVHVLSCIQHTSFNKEKSNYMHSKYAFSFKLRNLHLCKVSCIETCNFQNLY